ncbi:transglutaminase domain-containing protein [Arcanobacterium buesumense]|uniref:Transglutaminase-like domain-containing protein n=1 Tax=Arcanobacterium buesumense TaxID=2722751 RepID=A0A6H2END6_9ACTO|nr:transglutaminase domain-containing protein [Arcanobacterium buesumense]QJC22562.1 hypothetical protein HC352_08660 [Arcanobacterium buesumense]
MKKDDAIRADQRIDEIAQYLTAKLKDQKDASKSGDSEDYRKARLIHDYIIKNVEPEADDKTSSGQYYVDSAEGDGKKYEIHSLEAGLFAHKGVCQTYAIMFDRIASRMGLDTRYIRGKKTFGYYAEDDTRAKERIEKQIEAGRKIAAKGGRWPDANHSWNQVKIDGQWYHLDLTVDAVAARVAYKYTYGGFLLTDEEFGKPASWWLGVFNNKSYYTYVDVMWNQSEAQPATTPMNFGSLFNAKHFSRPILPHLDGKYHPLGSFNDLTQGTISTHTTSEQAQPVTQIVSAYGADEKAEIAAGTSADELLKLLKVQGITTQTQAEYVLGTIEDSPVSLETPDEWTAVKDTIDSQVDLHSVAENGAKLTIPVAVVKPGTESHALARIQAKNGSAHIDQIHPQGESYDERVDKDAYEAQRKVAEATILSDITSSYTDGDTNTSTIHVSVQGLDTIKLDTPGEYPVVVVAQGKDGLWTKLDYQVVVDEKQRPSSVTITTKDNADVLNVASDTKYYVDPSSFHSFLGKREGVNLIAKRTNSFGLTSQVDETISFVDSAGKEWPHNESEDIFIDADGNRLFNDIKMVDLVRKAGSYRIKVTAQYAQEAPKVRYITVNITNGDDQASEAAQHEAIMTVDRLENLSMTSKIKYENEIRELSSASAIADVVKRATNDLSEKTSVSYIVEHVDKETGQALTYPVKKIDFVGATVKEQADSYLLSKGHLVDLTEQELRLTGGGQKITFTYSRQADPANQTDTVAE